MAIMGPLIDERVAMGKWLIAMAACMLCAVPLPAKASWYGLHASVKAKMNSEMDWVACHRFAGDVYFYRENDLLPRIIGAGVILPEWGCRRVSRNQLAPVLMVPRYWVMPHDSVIEPPVTRIFPYLADPPPFESAYQW